MNRLLRSFSNNNIQYLTPSVLPQCYLRQLTRSIFSLPNQAVADNTDVETKIDSLNQLHQQTKFREREVDEFGRAYATGRRKTSVARVWVKEGSGQFIVNDKEFVDYFQDEQRQQILSANLASGTAGMFDVWCTVKGGGISGQAGAVRLGVSRALETFQPSLRPSLRKSGMLTRDSRRVERKKPGLKKARKQYQWVKR